jgi:Tubulin-tyrosine ligase family.
MSVSQERVIRLDSFQSINHFPGMTATLARKVAMARVLNRIRDKAPEEFAFYPQTWVLPEDMSDFRVRSLTLRATEPSLPQRTFAFHPQVAYVVRTLVLVVQSMFTDRRKSSKTFIVKPSAGCQGKGIFLTRNLDEIPATDAVVAQEYIANPMLLDGMK